MGLLPHGPGALGVQVKQRAPGVRKDCCTVIAGDVAEEQGHRDGRGSGLDALAGLVRATREVAGLGPGGCGVPRGLAPTQLGVLIGKRSFKRLRETVRPDRVAIGCLDRWKGGSPKHWIARLGHLEGKQRQAGRVDGV